MRRFSFILFVLLVTAPVAVAAKRAAGDGTFAVRAGSGKIVVTGRGTIFGQLGNGKLTITDPNPDDNIDALVSGAERTRPVNDNITVYYGKNIRFRFVGGRYTITVNGVGIDLSAVGKGSAQITGDPHAIDAGDYSMNGAKWLPLPTLAPTTASFPTGP